MKKLNGICVLLISVITFFVIQACSQFRPKVKDINPAFGQYISGYTSGMVSRKTTIRIELTNSFTFASTKKNGVAQTTLAINAILPDSNLVKDIFSFSPSIKGRTIWVSDRVIEFIPDNPLAINQFYQAEFKLDELLDVSSEFETFHFQFSTFPQNLFVTTDGLRAYDEYNIEWQKISGKITTSDYEDTAAIRKTITAKQDGKLLPIDLAFSYTANEYYFQIDSIERRTRAGKVTVSWDGALINAQQKGSKEIIVPGLGDFSVTEAKVIDNEDQHIEITLSDPIYYNQNLKGIIALAGIDNLTYAIEANIVKVFLPNRIVGVKELNVNTGIKNFKGYKMNNAFITVLEFQEPRPLVRIKGNGCILPNSNGLIFPFEAISLKAVDVRIVKIYENNVHQFLQVNDLNGESGLARVGKVITEKKIDLNTDKRINLKQWNTHVIDLGKLITPDPGSIYRVSIKYNKSYALCDCDTTENTSSNETGLLSSLRDSWNEDDWHSYSFENGYDTWDYSDNYEPCNENYYYGKAVSRNILASDIGLIYKLDDNKTAHAFATNMVTAKPLAGTVIEYYDYTKQLIGSGTCDASGMLAVQLKRKPFLMLAKYGKQRGYLKLQDGEANSLSKFDVDGEVVQKGIKGFIYGERGVWRPGDSLYLNFILEDKENGLPQNHPVKFELQDPNGQIIYQTTKTNHVNRTYSFRISTSTEAITGNYNATVKVGNRTFSENIKIETIKPNRLKINLNFGDNVLADTTAKLQVKWLHGAIAKNLHALVNVSVNQTKTTFVSYSDYVFDSPLRNYYSDADYVFDGNLNDKGEATIKTSLSKKIAAPGMLRATYITKVFEEGGDFSIDRFTTKYSPYNTYVGLHVPKNKGYDEALETGVNYKFDVATVNRLGKPAQAKKLQIKIYKMEWRWWYEKGSEELSSYISRSSTIVLKDTLLKSIDGKATFNFKVNYPEYGRYLITATDLEGGHQTGQVIYIDWPYWNRANRSENENASMLNFSCDKEKYSTGENVKLSFPSPSEGLALVSIESVTKVIKKFWIPTKKGETTYQFPVTADMTPNAYVHVTLMQPHANTKNDLPIRMYGLVPISVDNPATHLFPEIKMNDVIKPESITHIKIKEKTGKKMTYTVAMVDEGLLDLTRYKTPQPHTTFYAKEALGVKTWDMFNSVIGAFAGKLDKLISIGGDGDGAGGKGIKANRFNPMVKFMGPFVLEAGSENEHKIEIPNYVGSVRVMVVANYNGAYGSSEKAVAVRKPLMVLATLPRVLGPKETVSLPVTIFAMEKHVKDVKVNIEVNNLLLPEGAIEQTIHFSEVGDEVINFKLNVAEKTGIAKVKVTAISGKEKATQEIELDVRTANPKVVEGFETVVESGNTWDAAVALKGVYGTNKVTLELSSIPALGLEKRLDYLIQYPHGCIEQTISSIFPQLFVINLMELNAEQKKKINAHVKAGLKRLQLFQTANGGFSYWPGEAYESDWGSNYAGHFMIEAEKAGFSLPVNMKSKWINYQQSQAKNWSMSNTTYSHPHGSESNQLIQAYRLYVLALSGNAELGAMNRLREEKNVALAAKWRLAAAYELIGQHEVALQLIKGLPIKVNPYKELTCAYGSERRDAAMILETLSLLNENFKANEIAKEVTLNLNSDKWMSTQETAYSLLAMCVYAGVKNTTTELNFSYSLNGGAETNKSANSRISQVKFSDAEINKTATIKFKNTGKSKLYAKLLVEGVPLIDDKSSSANNLKMEVVYKNMKGQVIQPDKIIQGTDFMAVVTISNLGTKGNLHEMALNQIFPSGWEIHNSRMDDNGTASMARYEDIRDDRVFSYYELSKNTSKTFVVKLNATYLGKFYLPTVYSEAMYDNLINAKVPGRWVEVVKEDVTVAKK